MGIIIADHKLTKDDIKTAREEYDNFIKITIDTDQKIVAIGGEYHYDAKQILIKRFGSKNSSTWGGGYYTDTKIFSVNAHVNYKTNLGNPSGDILNEEARNKFLKLAKETLKNIESLL